MPDARTLAAVTVTVVLWSSAFPGIRAALTGYEPGHMVLLRFLLASVALGLLALATRLPVPRVQDLPGIFGLGLIGIGVYQAALTFGQQTLTAGAAALVVALTPVLMALLARLFLGERLTLWGWAGTALGFLGVALLAVGETGAVSLGAGVPLVLLAALATSVFFVLQKPYLGRYSALQFTTYGIWAGTVVMAGLWWRGLADAVTAAPLDATLSVVYLALFPGMVAYITWAYALARAPASILGNVIFLEPPLAMAIAYVWLAELPSLLAVVGGLIALAGVAIVSTKGQADASRSSASRSVQS